MLNSVRPSNQDEIQSRPLSQVNFTTNTIESLPEISDNCKFVFKLYFFVINILSSIIGFYLIYYRDYYIELIERKKFEHVVPLIAFAITYTFGIVTCLVLAIIFGFPVFLIMKCLLRKSADEGGMPFSTIASALLVVLIVLLYMAVIPYGLILFVGLFYLEEHERLFILYIFIWLNISLGFYLILIGIYSLICIKVKLSVRQNKNLINDDNLAQVQKEINEAYKEYNIDR